MLGNDEFFAFDSVNGFTSFVATRIGNVRTKLPVARALITPRSTESRPTVAGSTETWPEMLVSLCNVDVCACTRCGRKAVVEMSVGSRHTCARRMDGAVHCWGANEVGQLGDGTMTDRLTPTVVSGF